MFETFVILLLVLQFGLLVFVLLRVLKPANATALELESRLTREHVERLERMVRDELARSRDETRASLVALTQANEQKLEQMRSDLVAGSRSAREEQGNSLKSFSDSLASRMTEIATLQKGQLETFAKQIDTLTQGNEQRLERMRQTVEGSLKSLQEDNAQKLEQMRVTVDEKLHATLEHRLGESFKIVSERLELVHKGLGEMQALATGVGDLKKVLTNVKTRGMWGEIQLGNILEQILTPDQYSKNVSTKSGSNDRVEFAVKLPGRESGNGKLMWLPIDAKFPQEDYQRLVDAQEQANPVLAEEAGKQLETRIKNEGKNIHEKYLDPPHTTDFAIMFLPTEGLYAEVLRRPGLADNLQREHRIVIAGPTTLAAILNSLQMGFRTLAIEKRSSEVWALLASVKTEFGRFGEILERTKKKLEEASNSIDNAAINSRRIERKLRTVQEIPAVQESLNLIAPDPALSDEREELF
ncbi:MAG: DNA recombination protein RmuC [Bacteroidota bacterium]